MNTTPEHNRKIEVLTFSSVYPLYLKKIERKGRTKEELDFLITWLTGFDLEKINALIEEKCTFKTFFEKAKMNESSEQIKGTVCGYKIENLLNPLTKKVRILDKIVDDLAKGKTITKIINPK
ncbi:MAG: DUF2200 family protein [Crocinitomicaceae bacterium]|nr:DUF2200 family protein [Crocinitomicaceae bacterium]